MAHLFVTMPTAPLRQLLSPSSSISVCARSATCKFLGDTSAIRAFPLAHMLVTHSLAATLAAANFSDCLRERPGLVSKPTTESFSVKHVQPDRLIFTLSSLTTVAAAVLSVTSLTRASFLRFIRLPFNGLSIL